MKIPQRIICLIVLSFALIVIVQTGHAQGTAFTYQGRLNNGASAANGSFDLTFSLFSVSSGAGQVGSTITNTAITVSNGLFTVALDFGANFPGAGRWLEIGVRTNGNGAFTTLAPRQKITPTPYAITAVNLAGVVGNNTLGAANSFSTVAGGYGNVSTGNYSTVGGGLQNTAIGQFATIAGGIYNSNLANYTAIGGGFQNSASAVFATVGGGNINASSGIYATIGGGEQNISSSDYTVVGGGYNNTSSGQYSVAAGGLQNTSSGLVSTLGGGELNVSSGDHSTLGGGENNQCSGDDAMIGGGRDNICSNVYATVTGGYANISGGHASAVAGGENNKSTGDFSTIPGGINNSASGVGSFAAGNQAKANHPGTFVWGDWTFADFASSAANQFLIRAGGGVGIGVTAPQQQLSVAAGMNIDQNNANNGTIANSLIFGSFSGEAIASKRTAGGNQYGLDFYANNVNRMSIANNGNVGIGTNAPSEKLHVVGNFIRVDGGANEKVYMGGDGLGSDAQFGSLNSTITDAIMYNPTRGECMNLLAKTFTVCSDRNIKDIAGDVRAEEVLNKVIALPVQRWNYKGENDIQHIGPMAQDFYAAFSLGKDDKHIATVDADGVALAAIQGLNQKLTEELKRRDAENAELKHRLEKLERLIASKGDSNFAKNP